MRNTQTIGERIRARRDALGLKQQDVAEMAGMRASALCKLEKDRQPIRYSEIEALASALSCAAHDLIPPPKGKPRPPSVTRQPPRRGRAA